MTTIYPTQIGYVPTGVNGTVGISSVTIGRTITGSYEGIGFGQDGRPDYLNLLQINLANKIGTVITQKGTITINVADIMAIAGVPANLNLTLKEVTVCNAGATNKMIILGSQLYT
jgi:hypothetical protein